MGLPSIVRSVILVLFAFTLPCTAEAQTQAGVPPGRVATLARGVDLNQWFAQLPKQSYNHKWFQGWLTANDFSMLAKAGFTHVRFPIEFEMFFNEQNPSVLQTEYLGDLDTAINNIRAAGLSVVIDFHARKETKQRINQDPAFVDKVVQLWAAMAKHLAARDHDHVFFEVINEPVAIQNSQWWNIQGQIIAAIRAKDPGRTIIAAGDTSGTLSGLISHQPYSDRNIIYTFHFYDPVFFTHQGASWSSDPAREVVGVTYPADEANKTTLGNNYPSFRNRIMQYNGNARALSDHIAKAVNWANANGVPIYCGDFGVYGKYAPTDSRLRWLTDVRTILEQNHIPWAMWDYTSQFGVAMDSNGRLLESINWPDRRWLNPDTLQALGLSR